MSENLLHYLFDNLFMPKTCLPINCQNVDRCKTCNNYIEWKNFYAFKRVYFDTFSTRLKDELLLFKKEVNLIKDTLIPSFESLINEFSDPEGSVDLMIEKLLKYKEKIHSNLDKIGDLNFSIF